MIGRIVYIIDPERRFENIMCSPQYVQDLMAFDIKQDAVNQAVHGDSIYTVEVTKHETVIHAPRKVELINNA